MVHSPYIASVRLDLIFLLVAGVYPRGLCLSEHFAAPVPPQNERHPGFAPAPLAFVLTTKGTVECFAVVNPRDPEARTRREVVPRAALAAPAPGAEAREVSGMEEGTGTGGEGRGEARRQAFHDTAVQSVGCTVDLPSPFAAVSCSWRMSARARNIPGNVFKV